METRHPSRILGTLRQRRRRYDDDKLSTCDQPYFNRSLVGSIRRLCIICCWWNRSLALKRKIFFFDYDQHVKSFHLNSVVTIFLLSFYLFNQPASNTQNVIKYKLIIIYFRYVTFTILCLYLNRVYCYSDRKREQSVCRG